jgi:hypothetical protein
VERSERNGGWEPQIGGRDGRWELVLMDGRRSMCGGWELRNGELEPQSDE